MATPVVIVENASLPSARHHTATLAALPDVAAATGGGPAIILMGPQFAALHDVHRRCGVAWTAPAPVSRRATG